MLKMMHRIQKNPTQIEKDEGFKRFQKRYNGGEISNSGSQLNTEILIEEGVMDKIETKKVIKLEDEIENLHSKNDDSWNNEWISNVWNDIGSHWEAILTMMHAMDIIGVEWMSVSSGVTFVPYALDAIGLTTITMMNIWCLCYPGEEANKYMLNTQYLLYSFILLSSFTIGGAWILPNAIWIAITGATGLTVTIVDDQDSTNKKSELEKTKLKLVNVLENPVL